MGDNSTRRRASIADVIAQGPGYDNADYFVTQCRA
jgi:hypothetical protein